jgi:hypothetical protein
MAMQRRLNPSQRSSLHLTQKEAVQSLTTQTPLRERIKLMMCPMMIILYQRQVHMRRKRLRERSLRRVHRIIIHCLRRQGKRKITLRWLTQPQIGPQENSHLSQSKKINKTQTLSRTSLIKQATSEEVPPIKSRPTTPSLTQSM